MKRLIILLAVVAIGIMIFAAPMFADPGDGTSTSNPADTTWTNPDYPPPPDGYVGPWPPPDGSTTTTTTGDGGDEGGWIEPDE
jgi:hypothetical protein